MTYKLSQIERTLLSAYLDGEVSPAERLKAEHLLKISEEARNYLRDLHAVDYLSSAAIVAPPAVGGAVTVGASAKLTGTAIKAAAKRAAATKGAALGPWGIGGLASAAAAVVVGVALSVNTDGPAHHQQPPAATGGKHLARMADPMVPVTQALHLDTSDLLVPPMTTADLYAFAVHGTLPIDANREQFITLAPKGGDSLQVKVHGCAPEDITSEVAKLELTKGQALDSIQRVIRTSLIHCTNGGLALRADLPQVRLAAIRSLERVGTQLPERVRERLDQTRLELVAVEQAIQRAPSGGYYAGSAARPVAYRMIYQDRGGFRDWKTQMLPPNQFVVEFNNEPSFTIDQRSLVSLQSMMRTPPPMQAVPQVFEEPMQVMVGTPSAYRMEKKVRPLPRGVEAPHPIGAPIPVVEVDEEGYAEEGNDPLFFERQLDNQANEYLQQLLHQRRSLRDLRIIMEHEDSVMNHTRRMIDSAHRSIQRVDSMLNRVEIRYRSRKNSGGINQVSGKGGSQSMEIILDGNGAAHWKYRSGSQGGVSDDK